MPRAVVHVQRRRRLVEEATAPSCSATVLFGTPATAWVHAFAGWFISDASGTLLVGAPLMLWWIDRRSLSYRHWPGFAAIAGLLLLVAMSRLLLPPAVTIPTGVPFLIVLASSWLFARYPAREAVTLFAFAAFLIAAGFALSPTPVLAEPPATAARVVGLAVAAGMLNVLLIGVATEERVSAVRRLWRDDLTGLLSQRSFFDAGARELAWAARYGRPLSVCVFTINELDEIERDSGAPVRDSALVAVAGHIGAELRPTDLFARFDDGHFVIVMPEADERDATALVEGFSASLAGTPVVVGDRVLSISTRAGVATRRVGDAIQTVAGRARSALYLSTVGERTRTA